MRFMFHHKSEIMIFFWLKLAYACKARKAITSSVLNIENEYTYKKLTVKNKTTLDDRNEVFSIRMQII